MPGSPMSGPYRHSAVVAELVARVAALEERLRALEDAPERVRAAGVGERDRIDAIALPVVKDFETEVGLTWFNRIGAVVLVAALVLAALWANQHGYLAPVVRNALGFVAALVVFAIGLRASLGAARGHSAFGLGVALVGAAGLYLVGYTSARVDAVVPELVVTVYLVGLTAGLGVLAAATDRFYLALLGLLGGLAVPVMVGSGDAPFALVYGYLIPVVAGFVALQHGRRWAGLDAVGSLGMSAYLVVWLSHEHAAPVAMVGLALWGAHLAYLEVRARRGDALAHMRMPARLAAALAVICVYFALPAAAGVACALLVLHVRRIAGDAEGDDALPEIAIAGVLAVALGAAPGISPWWAAIAAAGCAALAGASRASWAAIAAVLLAGGAAAGFVLGADLADSARSLALSAVMIAGGVALVATGVLGGHRPPRIAGLVLLATALAKVVVVDLWSLPGGLRIGVTAALGAGLLAASFAYSRLADRA